MKKIITFDQDKAILERSESVATLTIIPSLPVNTLPMGLAELADKLNELDFINVFQILPPQGKITFQISKRAKNSDVLAAVCEAILDIYTPYTAAVAYDKRFENAV